jgi:hypothetical protein
MNSSVVGRVIFQFGSRSEEAMTANKEPKQKHKRPEKHAQQHADLGQKKARLEKEKEAQLSAMGQTSHGPAHPEEDEGHS